MAEEEPLLVHCRIFELKSPLQSDRYVVDRGTATPFAPPLLLLLRLPRNLLILSCLFGQ